MGFRFAFLAATALLTTTRAAAAAMSPKFRARNAMEEELFSKMVPLHRSLEDNNADGDDYYLDADNMYSLSGFSLKYAKCQPLQRFSEDAVKSGEHTPMVTEDVVVLRLCPSRFCLTSRTYGCQYNYAEYAIGLSDYVRVMIRYTSDRQTQLCNWCNACENGGRRQRRRQRQRQRRLEEGQQEGQNEENRDENEDQNDNEEDHQEEGQNNENNDQNDNDDQEDEANDGDADAGDDYYQANDDDNANAANGDNNYYYDAGDDVSDECSSYNSYCLDDDGASVCVDSDDDAYLDTLDYLDYLYCTKITDNDNYNYYVRPRCDGTSGTIKMAVYHDAFCSQYAGNDVSLKNFGLGFRESIFKDYYENDSCIDCSESNYPPYFNANSNMCNRMHTTAGTCTANMQYDLFGAVDDDSTVCSFIESIRFGTYDEYGRLQGDGSSSQSQARTVTDGQKFGMAFSIILCSILAVYSCYLHHSITNLLIKSLSHTDLLPPSRHKTARSVRSSRSKTRRNGRKSEEDTDDDWDVRGVPA